MTTPKPLKLHGEDVEDLAIMASCLQNATGHLGNMLYRPRQREFHCLFNRIPREIIPQERDPDQQPIGCILRFCCVLTAHGRNLDWQQKQTPLSLLTLYFHAGEPPGGMVRLLFTDEREICLQVEALEAWLRDVPQPWDNIIATRSMGGSAPLGASRHPPPPPAPNEEQPR